MQTPFNSVAISLFLLPYLLQGGLVHRYSFSDADNGSIHDSVGDTSASLKGGAGLDNLGALQLDGVNDWLELPSDLLSNLQNLSVEAWLEWDGPASSSWQTLFVFSRDNLGYFSFSPRAGTSPRKARFAVAQNGPEKKVNGNAEFPTGEVVHVVTVFDSVSQELRLYVDGILQGSSVCSFALASIDIKNLWIGRPLYTQFPYFKGRLLMSFGFMMMRSPIPKWRYQRILVQMYCLVFSE